MLKDGQWICDVCYEHRGKIVPLEEPFRYRCPEHRRVRTDCRVDGNYVYLDNDGTSLKSMGIDLELEDDFLYDWGNQ